MDHTLYRNLSSTILQLEEGLRRHCNSQYTLTDAELDKLLTDLKWSRAERERMCAAYVEELSNMKPPQYTEQEKCDVAFVYGMMSYMRDNPSCGISLDRAVLAMIAAGYIKTKPKRLTRLLASR